jgi:hypothetical protein
MLPILRIAVDPADGGGDDHGESTGCRDINPWLPLQFIAGKNELRVAGIRSNIWGLEDLVSIVIL